MDSSVAGGADKHYNCSIWTYIMQALTLIGIIDSDGHLRLDIPTQLPAGNVELVVVIRTSQEKPNPKKYDFSDLTGKLTLQGEPVEIQRRMRDAW